MAEIKLSKINKKKEGRNEGKMSSWDLQLWRNASYEVEDNGWWIIIMQISNTLNRFLFCSRNWERKWKNHCFLELSCEPICDRPKSDQSNLTESATYFNLMINNQISLRPFRKNSLWIVFLLRNFYFQRLQRHLSFQGKKIRREVAHPLFNSIALQKSKKNYKSKQEQTCRALT